MTEPCLSPRASIVGDEGDPRYPQTITLTQSAITIDELPSVLRAVPFWCAVATTDEADCPPPIITEEATDPLIWPLAFAAIVWIVLDVFLFSAAKSGAA